MERELARQLSSSASELESGFAIRLKEAIGPHPVLQFARKAGISDSLIRKYLKGSLPGLANLIALADAAEVRVAWLATGELPKQQDGVYTAVTREEDRHYQVSIDDQLLQKVVKVVRESEHAQELTLSPRGLAKAVSILYRHCMQNSVDVDPVTARQIVEMAAEL